MTNHAPNTISAPTPGPWAVQQSSNPGNGASWRDIVATGEALERDADLIAAAPDLLDALKKLLSALQPGAREGSVQAQAIARAAIDTAENRIA